MNGGGGGYHRPSGNSGSGEDDADNEDPSSVPAPDPDSDEESADPPIDEPDSDSEGTNEKPGDTPGSPPPTGSGGGSGSSGVPPTDPGIGGTEDDNNDPPEEPEDGSHEPAEESSQNEDQDDTNQDDLEDSEEHEPEEEEEEDDEESEEEEDEECLLTESAQLHSPNPDALDTVTEGDIYSVQLRDQSVCIVDEDDQTIGAIAEPWVDTIKSCLRDGWQYRAHILEMDGGYCEVRVTNKCRLNQQIALNSVNSAITSNLHPGRILPVEKTDQSEIIVTTHESRVGTVPDPWAGPLSDCITQGHAYHAEVVDVLPDHCQIIIQNGPSTE